MDVERLELLADRAVGRSGRLVDRPQLVARGEEFHPVPPVFTQFRTENRCALFLELLFILTQFRTENR
ncbi:hypothetical protein EJ070_09850 [Mesorhizobium sp. M1E.F.Ca.ET.045.02.1.1]|nr:hypothetical protein EJ070_09850 [Mesorhizobium sp. M1E.F.Ca.ET.045.02.1.1]RUW81461.1 hypothetical protein EOA29_20760 [Mesorhizobium sp. M1E.F.Ca.ET.063.01.1.1]RWB50747.1 MAG: hypothetical protein EOQ47_32295 [Mesorhizobium sp.]